MGKALGFMLFFIGLGMVIGLLVSETTALLIAAALCMLCIIYFVNKMGMKRLSANPFIPIYILCNYPFIKIISVWEKLLWSLLKKGFLQNVRHTLRE